MITIQNPEAKQVENRIIRRGKEAHGPDRMYINMSHVVMIEPVSPDSKVAQVIKDMKAQAGENK